jgi:hypothetical protein
MAFSWSDLQNLMESSKLKVANILLVKIGQN